MRSVEFRIEIPPLCTANCNVNQAFTKTDRHELPMMDGSESLKKQNRKLQWYPVANEEESTIGISFFVQIFVKTYLYAKKINLVKNI